MIPQLLTALKGRPIESFGFLGSQVEDMTRNELVIALCYMIHVTGIEPHMSMDEEGVRKYQGELFKYRTGERKIPQDL